ncbi:MAG: hypothetical protein QXH97_01715 [Candidatus Bathyarchaeia archaeon]
MPKVATAKFGTLVIESARVADIAIRAIILAKTIAFDSKGGIRSLHPTFHAFNLKLEM